MSYSYLQNYVNSKGFHHNRFLAQVLVENGHSQDPNARDNGIDPNAVKGHSGCTFP
ncbi:hypothetical protein BDZ89DRAFT_1065625 [Hymenopellis radicata]|nr:hypothetical protein BDZ89DRAFT_1065625 [Hymenopellis radicata]